MNTRVWLIELGLVAALGLARAPGRAAAAPATPPRPAAQITAALHRDGGPSYILFRDEHSLSMSGDQNDLGRARRYQHAGEPLLWFRDGDREYLVRDPATLGQLDVIWKASRELEDAEDKLDRQRDGLDRKHDQLDARRDELDSRRDALADRESALDDHESDDSLAPAARAELTKQHRDLQQQQRALASQMRALEPPMQELRAQMDAIRRQLDALRPRRELASRTAETELRAWFRRAVAAGTAKPVP